MVIGGRPDRRTVGLWLLALTSLLSARLPVRQSNQIILATTTSTRDAGLLDSLLPVFERRTGYTVKVIAVGSGQALAMGRRGDADVVLSHAPEAERALVDSGYFVSRRLVMHNDFLFVGPPGDPAGLRGMTDPVAALQRIAQREASFVSRGDQSGTHQMEQKLWRVAGIRPPGVRRLPGVAGGASLDRRVRKDAVRPEPVRAGCGKGSVSIGDNACPPWGSRPGGALTASGHGRST